MAVLAKLVGVGCAECARRGHRCQAQLWSDGRPLCLRCADGEPCIYLTAQGGRERFRREFAEDCDVRDFINVPILRRPRRIDRWLPVMGAAERKLIHYHLDTRSVRLVARDFHMPEWVIEAIREGKERDEMTETPAAPRGAKLVDQDRLPSALPPRKPERKTPLNMRGLRAAIARYFGVESCKFDTRFRGPGLATKRQILMYFAHHFTGASFTEIGANLGGLHHSTVLYGVRTITEKQSRDPQVKKDIKNIKTALGL
jgi:hypothetical protein